MKHIARVIKAQKPIYKEEITTTINSRIKEKRRETTEADNPQDWNKVVSFMKDHPKVFMDLMNEHSKLDKFANEAY